MSVTMKDLFRAGVHFGHLSRFRNPQMDEYIYTVNNQVCIINLEKTLPMFKSSIDFVKNVAKKGGKILFVGTKRSASKIVKEAAEKCGMPYVNYRWLGGMLTNYKTIRGSVRRLTSLTKKREEGGFQGLTKKEMLNMEREIIKLENSFNGIKDMGGLPDAIFVVDVGYQDIAVKEANKLKIPVIGVVDTNSSPDGLTYMIPGNDDSMRAISLYANTVADTINSVHQEQKAKASVTEEDFVEVVSNEADESEEI